MIIDVTCPICGHKSGVPDELAGQATRCPKCSETIRVPGIVALPKREPKAASPKPTASSQALIPTYSAMSNLAKVLRLFALLSYVLAVILFAIAYQSHDGASAISAAGLFGSGLFLHAASEAMNALRDIAQNSFKR